MSRVDPTQTATLRKRYAQQMNRRFMDLSKDVRKYIIDDDNLNIKEFSDTTIVNYASLSISEKTKAFISWLQQKIENNILEIVTIKRNLRRISSHWQDVFLRGAYIRGVKDTEAKLNQAGALEAPTGNLSAVISTGQSFDTLELLYSRSFENLKGITSTMSAQLNQILTDSLIEGVGPKVIAKRITDQIGSISRNRAMLIAQTETIRAFAEASLNTMERNSIDEVEADVEFSTARDGRVCSRCKSLEGKKYTINQARGVIPVHPRCLTENSFITFSPNIIASFKYPYNGDIYRVTTHDGIILECTPNHPVLTNAGWLPTWTLNRDKHYLVKTGNKSDIHFFREKTKGLLINELHSHINDNLGYYKKSNSMMDGREFYNDGVRDERCEILYFGKYNKDYFRNWLIYEDHLGYDILRIMDIANTHISFSSIDTIEKVNYKGYVYDLETEGSFFCVDDIVVHNCRCRWLPVVEKSKNFISVGYQLVS